MPSWAGVFDGAPVAQADRARAEAARYPTAQAFWDACERGDWLLWAAGRLGVDSRVLVAAASDCARQTLDVLEEDARKVAADALAAADLWCEGRVGPGDCRTAVNKVHREAERTVPIEDPRLAAGRTSALGAVEAAVQAAAWSDDRLRCAEFASHAARRVANTWLRIEGPDEAEAAHARCATAVRVRIPSRALPS